MSFCPNSAPSAVVVFDARPFASQREFRYCFPGLGLRNLGFGALGFSVQSLGVEISGLGSRLKSSNFGKVYGIRFIKAGHLLNIFIRAVLSAPAYLGL